MELWQIVFIAVFVATLLFSFNQQRQGRKREERAKARRKRRP